MKFSTSLLSDLNVFSRDWCVYLAIPAILTQKQTLYYLGGIYLAWELSLGKQQWRLSLENKLTQLIQDYSI